MSKIRDLIKENYKELIELIPSIQESVLKGLERDQKSHVYNIERIRIKAKLYSEIFKLIQGKWTLEIYYVIMMCKSCGFNDLRKALPEINSRTLTDRLRLLEQRHIVSRTVLTESPIKVQYKLTDFGREVLTLFVPSIMYFLLPKSIRKNLPKIKTIEESARAFIAQESDKLIH